MMSPPRLGNAGCPCVRPFTARAERAGKEIGRCPGPARRRRLSRVGNLFPPGHPATAFANAPRAPHNTTRDRSPTLENQPVADNDLTPPAAAAPAPTSFDIEK